MIEIRYEFHNLLLPFSSKKQENKIYHIRAFSPNHFHVDTIKQLFNDVPIDNVFLFLKEINLFNKL